MKTSSNYKLGLIRAALRRGHSAYIKTGTDLEYTVQALILNHGHTVIFKLDRNNGFLAVDPDDITHVRLLTLPAKLEAEAS